MWRKRTNWALAYIEVTIAGHVAKNSVLMATCDLYLCNELRLINCMLGCDGILSFGKHLFASEKNFIDAFADLDT